MEEKVINDILKVCEVLNKRGVKYMVIGGTALAFHGHYRMTMLSDGRPADKHDFDFWYNPGSDNYKNLLGALEDLGIDVSKEKAEKMPNPRTSFFSHEFDDFKIDFLPEVLGLGRFNQCFDNKITAIVNGTEINILSKADLIKSKEASSRKKDLNDLNELKSHTSRDNNE